MSKPFKTDWFTVRFNKKKSYPPHEHTIIWIPRMGIGIKLYGDDFWDNTYMYFFLLISAETNETCEYVVDSSFPKNEFSVWCLLEYMRFYSENNGMNVDVDSERRLCRRFSRDSIFAFLCYRRRMCYFVERNKFIDKLMWYRDACTRNTRMWKGPLSTTTFTDNHIINLKNWK